MFTKNQKLSGIRTIRLFSLALILALVVNLTSIPAIPARAAGYIDPTGSPRIAGMTLDLKQVAGLSNGKVALLFDNHSTPYVQVLNVDGSQVYSKDLTAALGARAVQHQYMYMYPIANGELIVTIEGYSGGCDNNTDRLFMFLRLDASGAVSTALTAVSAATRPYNCYTNMAELSNGNLAFTYQINGDEYALRIFQPNGTAVTSEASIQKTGAYSSGTCGTGQSTYTTDIAANDAGTFLITHYCNSNANFYGVLYNNNGTQVTVGSAQHFVIGTWNNSPYQSTMALTDNNYMVAYTSNNKVNFQFAKVQPNGTVTNVGLYTPTDAYSYGDFRSLGDGGFVAIDYRISTVGAYDYYYDNAVVYSNSGSITQAATDLDTNYIDRCDAGTYNNCLSSAGFLWLYPPAFAGYSKGVLYVNGLTLDLVLHSFSTPAPTVTDVSATTANGSYTIGTTVAITVTFSASVTVTDTPQLALNSGGTAAYASGSGSTTLNFNYSIAAGQNSTDLDYTSTSALSLNGGTIRTGSTDASLTLPAPGAAHSLGANKNIVIDTTAPAITINNPNTSPATSKTLTASVPDGTLTMSNTNGSTCNGTLTFVAYASQTFTTEADNGMKVCYRAVDSLGNTGYSLSNAIAGIDTTAPAITINNPNTSPATSKTLTASVPDGTLTMSNTSGSTCDGTLTFVAYSSQTFTAEADNGTKVCYRAVDGLGNTGYSLSNAIAGIDTTAPAITINNPNTSPPRARPSPPASRTAP